jgi:5-formyltetrahydrofolate cyclo-ligase
MRARVRAAVAALTPQERRAAASRLTGALWQGEGPLAGLADAGGVLLGYMALADEIDPRPAMRAWQEAGGRVAVPVTNWAARQMQAAVVGSLDDDAFERRDHGVLEPRNGRAAAAEDLAAVLVPGVAFDASGGRLGRGAGFYDRYLDTVACPTIGVCFVQQLVERVVREPHDVEVAVVIGG